jgi:two-component system chemotaxis response regulator CheB
MTGDKPLQILVVDDSALMRKMVGDIIEGTEGMALAGTARNGIDALEKVHRLRPDVITLDLEMPQMDGLQALARIMADRPTPTVILSAHAREGAESTLLALELGAVDFVTKPSGSISLDITRVRDQLVEKIRVAADVDLTRLRTAKLVRPVVAAPSRPDGGAMRVVAVGSSTGGTRALAELLPRLPADLNAGLLLVQHMPVGFTKSLAERLNGRCKITIREAQEGDRMARGLALLAPGGWHLRLDGEGAVALSQDPPQHGVRPSVDVMMESLAATCTRPMVGVVLTGMGRDGADGIAGIKRRGGHTIAEDRSTCVVYGMPKAAVETGSVDEVLPLDQIPEAIVRECSR